MAESLDEEGEVGQILAQEGKILSRPAARRLIAS